MPIVEKTQRPITPSVDAARTTCLHCDLPIPSDRQAKADPYCCEGCRTVYRLIHDEGLDRFYDLRRGSIAPPSTERPDSFAWLDGILGDDSAGERGASCRLTLDVQGVHCAACVWLLEELYRRAAGGVQIRINPTIGKADLVWDSDRGDLRDYLREAETFGYRFGPSRKGAPRRSRGLLARLGVCVAAAMNVMIFSLSYYFGLAPRDGTLYTFFGQLSIALATVSVVVGGWVFFKAAVIGIRRRLIHLDLPIALGIALAYAGSVYAYVSAGPEAAYFDTVTIFVALMLVGRYLQERVLERNRNTLLESGGIENLFAKRFEDGRLASVPVSAIALGDEIWLVPGDLAPIEGTLLGADAEISLDWITGESEVRALEPGDRVPAGAFNAGHTTVRMAAMEPFSRSRLNDLLRIAPPNEATTDAPNAAARGGEGRRWWSRVGSVYVGAVLTLALAGFLTWAGRDVTKAIEVTIAILVVTCPCALGLATPLANELVHIALRRRGVFLRSGTFFDRALSVKKVLFDKTGTLTMGRLALTPASCGALDALDADARRVLLNMTARSNHPASRCLSTALADGTAPELDAGVDDVVERPGRGIKWARTDGVYRLGRPDFALDGALSASDETVFSLDGRQIASFAFREEIKGDAAEEVRRLADDGQDVYQLSGDVPAKVLAAARELGIPADRSHGGLSPEEKAEYVRRLDAGDTLMVGDGINDGPSFEAALCAATPAVDRPALPGKADFYFLGEGIAAVRRALAAATKLRAIVRRNLIFAVVYNAAALALCFAGRVTPVAAAILMPLSSVAIVTLTAYQLSGRRLTWMS